MLLASTLAGCQEDIEMVTSTPTVTGRTTVSGLSAGGYMAVQAHIALADRIVGVAALAAGPYNCAQGNIGNALSRCMRGGGIDVAALAEVIRQRADAGNIAALSNLANARVWLFHSPADAVISSEVAAASGDLYRLIAPQIDLQQITNVEVAHGWPTLDTGLPCTEQGGDFINACNYDAAGALLAHLYGELAPAAVTPSVLETLNLENLLPAGSSIAASAPMLVPDRCRSGEVDCRLHLAFHGCRQGMEFVDDRFVQGTGLNRWAASNDIVVVYPQVEKSAFNPQGCWDWWGYTGDQYDQRGGPQIAAIAAIIDRFEDGTLF